VPVSFPLEKEHQQHAFTFWDLSKDPDGMSAQGPWAHGPSLDGRGTFEHLADPQPLGQVPHLQVPPSSLHSAPLNSATSNEPGIAPPGHEKQSLIERVSETLTGNS